MSMDLKSLPNGFALLLTMCSKHFSADTIDRVTNSLNSMTATDRAAKQATLLGLLDNNISEADFLKELEK